MEIFGISKSKYEAVYWVDLYVEWVEWASVSGTGTERLQYFRRGV